VRVGSLEELVSASWQGHSVSAAEHPNFVVRQSVLSNHTQPTKWYVFCAVRSPDQKETGADCIQAPAATGGKKQKKKWSKGKGT